MQVGEIRRSVIIITLILQSIVPFACRNETTSQPRDQVRVAPPSAESLALAKALSALVHRVVASDSGRLDINDPRNVVANSTLSIHLATLGLTESVADIPGDTLKLPLKLQDDVPRNFAVADDNQALALLWALNEDLNRLGGATFREPRDSYWRVWLEKIDYSRNRCDQGKADIPRSCDVFKTRKGSEVVLSRFEQLVLSLWTSRTMTWNEFNEFLEGKILDGKRALNNAVSTLAMISALRKLNRETEETFSGADDLAPSARDAHVTLTGASVSETVAKYCSYLTETSTYSVQGFLASSLDRKIAETFARPIYLAKGRVPVLFKIKGKTGVLISALAEVDSEKEVLFLPDRRFTIDADSVHIVLKIDPQTTRAVGCGTELTPHEEKLVRYVEVSLAEN